MLNLWSDAAIISWRGHSQTRPLASFRRQSEKALESIRNMLSAEARTVRAARAHVSRRSNLCRGTSFSESGDKIPATLRLVDAKNLPHTRRRR
jgi:magnesium-transporting ATPase (P-type)